MSKHTSGPWKAHFEESYFVTGPDLGRVATMTNLKGRYGILGRRSEEETAANARLIAAAPDLLEALKELCAAQGFMNACAIHREEEVRLHAVDRLIRAQERADAAIAKAEGA